MTSSSSAKRVARLAQKGKGKKVRFQGGTLFPTVMSVVVVLGLALIVYARSSAPDKNVPPTSNDHWHISYGIYTCADPAVKNSKSEFLDNLVGNKEDETSGDYQTYNIHSHDDGVIHWHAYSGLATGTRAKIGIFLNTYGVTVNKDGITFGTDQNGGKNYLVASNKCTDKSGASVSGVVKVVVWDQYDNEKKFATYVSDKSLADKSNGELKYIANFNDIRVKKDGMAMTFAFVAPDETIPMPPTASNLPALGSADVDGGATTTTVAGSSTTTVAGGVTTTTAG